MWSEAPSLEHSWEYVGPIVDEMVHQAQPPVICYFQTVDFVLPEEIRRKGTALKFCTQANASVYRSETYLLWYGSIYLSSSPCWNQSGTSPG